MNLWEVAKDKTLEKVHKKEDKDMFVLKTSIDRMKLHRMSTDNKFFLFEDKYK